MAAVDSAIAEMENILRGLKRDAEADVLGTKRATLVVEARRKIIEQMGNLLAAIDEDPAFKARPELATEFRTRLTELRRTLAALQAKWRASTITEDYKTYELESAPVAKASHEFLAWAKALRARV